MIVRRPIPVTSLVLLATALAVWGCPQASGAGQQSAAGVVEDDSDVSFAPGPPLQQARMAHHSVTLPDGSAALFGGHGTRFASLNTAEFLSPEGAGFELLTMHYTHDEGAFAQLADGRILLAGGSADLGIPRYAHSEVYDPATRRFTPVGDMVRFRASAGSVALRDGRVLVAGAWWTHNDAHTYGELFDPGTGTFAATAAFGVQRAHPVVLPTADGRAVVLGGIGITGGLGDQPVEFFDPASGTTGVLQERLFSTDPGWAVMGHKRPAAMQQLADGRYLYLAQRTQQGVTSYQLFTFDPATLAIAPVAAAGLPDSQSLFLLDQPVIDTALQRAYIVGQVAGSSPVEVKLVTVILHTSTVLVSSTGHTLDYHLSGAGITRLGDGRLLVSGGSADGSNFQPVDRTLYITPPAGQPPVSAVVEARDARPRPQHTALHANYPNPFNSGTVIPFVLAAPASVRLEVCSLLGQRVRLLVDQHIAAGMHRVPWDGRDHAGRPLTSGTYLYRLRVGAHTQTRSMLLLR